MKKIVMIRRTGLGDFIAGTVPICNYLEKIHGKCEFHFFMKKHNSFLVKYFFPDAHVYHIPSGNKYIQTLKTALQNAHIKPDIGFSPMPDYPKLNSLFLRLIGAKERYGRVTNSMFTQYFNHPYHCKDTSDLYNMSVGLCSLKYYDQTLSKIPQDCYPKFIQSLIAKHSLPETTLPKIMVEVSNNRPTSQLCQEKTATILNVLAQKFNFSVLITAKEKDYDKALSLKSNLNPHTTIFTTPNFDEFLSYVNAADIVLCGDGGLGHIAGALSKKVVALYGKTSIAHWGIIGDEVLHLYDEQDVNNISNSQIINTLSSYLTAINNPIK